ncbi:Uncharacterized protein involved in exopolysaccharide biosynthesis [Pseudooceanicola antarcticus]|uniref:Uncharacterized protein involved in exopolysaccharide biosynthesis n=1 Tax=Pseudooceanicola antarcticus TaxID=1247613 RepID=A0A285IKH2_9RHOB|nr:hypothetical protein [Pseudooceanicola antarcticus]PJE28786.1 hypothetical protein CVM39_09975 [Pseudooceanicola antarcticus]SNY48247.1 Uncharacterized protein involved in exopolysaccharide biosynthesis [Pseudooceanicola antarcticus]
MPHASNDDLTPRTKTVRPAPEGGRRLVPRLIRKPLGALTAMRLLRGGRIADAGRLPRYLALLALGGVAIWAPILSYLDRAPLRYTSSMSLILPGSGASASVNLAQIGQASSSSNSPFNGGSVSPTETYKRLLAAERIVAGAAGALDMPLRDFGQPRVELVDQTGLIHIAVTGNSPEDARARGTALLDNFFQEIDRLRSDEIATRELRAGSAIEEYRASVMATRDEITRLQTETGLLSPDQYNTLVAETDTLAQRVQDLEAKLQESSRAVDALAGSLGTSPRLAAAALRLHADTEFAALNDEVSQRATELSQARARYGASHPTLQNAAAGHRSAHAEALGRAIRLTGLSEAEIEALDFSHVGSRTSLLSELVTLDSARAGLEAEYRSVASQLAVAEARRTSLIEPAARLEDLQRDFSVAEAVFASAMARSQTGKADLYASYPLVQVLEDPSLPFEPSSPRRMLALAAGVAASLMFFIGLTLAWMRRPMIDRLIDSGKNRYGEPGLIVAAE